MLSDATYQSGLFVPAEPARTSPLYEIGLKGFYVEIRHLRALELTDSVSRAIWDEALALCRAKKCSSILRSGYAPVRRMTPQELADVGSSLDMPALNVACCWDDYRPNEKDAILATHAMKRGVIFRHFCSIEDATRWLSEGQPGSAASFG
jgi:hypothetical protein